MQRQNNDGTMTERTTTQTTTEMRDGLHDDGYTQTEDGQCRESQESYERRHGGDTGKDSCTRKRGQRAADGLDFDETSFFREMRVSTCEWTIPLSD